MYVLVLDFDDSVTFFPGPYASTVRAEVSELSLNVNSVPVLNFDVVFESSSGIIDKVKYSYHLKNAAERLQSLLFLRPAFISLGIYTACCTTPTRICRKSFIIVSYLFRFLFAVVIVSITVPFM